MPNALTLFKAITTLSDTWLQFFDARAIAVQGNLVITTPNMHFVSEFHHFDEEVLQARADGCFGIIDCFQWPQAYDESFCHAACIPRKEAFLSPHPLHWAWFTPTQNDLKSIPGNLFPVGTLTSDKVKGLQSLFKLAEQQLPQPLTTSGLHHAVRGDWMGTFVQSSDLCEKLTCADVPVWYVHASAYISPNMKVVQPVLLTRPDHIIIGMYAEGSKVRPFEVIYRGPGGHSHHVHICCLYAGTTLLDPKAANPQPSSSSNSDPKGSSHGKVPSQQKSKPKHQPYSIEARPACPAQSGESRDKWQDPDTPYLPPPNLHWEAVMTIAIKDQSHIHKPYIINRGYRFPEPALLISPKLPERLQTYLANWLASHALVPSAQPQSHQEKAPDRKGLMATEKWKQVMQELFGDDLLESQGNVFLPDGVVEFRGEEISVGSLTNPSALLAQKVTWELFELSFRYGLRDLDHHLAQREWKEDPAGREQLLYGIFSGDAGLVMWSEPFLSEHYRLWDNS